MNPRVKLTPELENQILASIRMGGYPHVAAAAWGVPEWLWDQWMQWGAKRNPRQPYKNFHQKVEQAKAQARLKAEMAAMENDPRFWLKNGPGKERPDSPGWAAMVRPILTSSSQTINLFTSPDFIQFMQTLRQVLAPYPEALKALAEATEKQASQPALPPPKEVIECPPVMEKATSRKNEKLTRVSSCPS